MKYMPGAGGFLIAKKCLGPNKCQGAES